MSPGELYHWQRATRTAFGLPGCWGWRWAATVCVQPGGEKTAVGRQGGYRTAVAEQCAYRLASLLPGVEPVGIKLLQQPSGIIRPSSGRWDRQMELIRTLLSWVAPAIPAHDMNLTNRMTGCALSNSHIRHIDLLQVDDYHQIGRRLCELSPLRASFGLC